MSSQLIETEDRCVKNSEALLKLKNDTWDECKGYPWITDLRAVAVYGSCSVDLSKFALHISKAQTHVSGVLIREDLQQNKKRLSHVIQLFKQIFIKYNYNKQPKIYLNGFLIDGPCVCDPINLCCPFDVDVKHLMAFLLLYSRCGSLIHSHGMPSQTVFLLQLSIQQVDRY